MSDKSFDELVERFRNNIYGSRKGQIRFAILWRYFQEKILSELSAKPIRVLDAGCGLGQISRQLLELGHEVTLCDISSEMLAEAKQSIPEPLQANARFVNAPIQGLGEHVDGQFDLLVCHAVLEWGHEPDSVINELSQLCRPGGSLSLMFYNRDALVFRNLIRGNWRKVLSGDLSGDPGGLTPINPIEQRQVSLWLGQAGFEIGSTIGLRTFFDFLPRQMQQERDLEDIMALEYHYSSLSPYKDMARYIHIHAYKNQ